MRHPVKSGGGGDKGKTTGPPRTRQQNHRDNNSEHSRARKVLLAAARKAIRVETADKGTREMIARICLSTLRRRQVLLSVGYLLICKVVVWAAPVKKAVVQPPVSTAPPKGFWELLWMALEKFPGGPIAFVIIVLLLAIGVVVFMCWLAVKHGRSMNLLGFCVGPTPKDEGALRAEIQKRDAMITLLGETGSIFSILFFSGLPERAPEAFAGRLLECLQDRLGILAQVLASGAGQVKRASIMLACEDGGKRYLRFIATIGISDRTKKGFRPAIGTGTICGEAAHNRRTINVPDVNTDSRWMRFENDTRYRSLIATPIVSADNVVIGVLNVDGQNTGAFGPDDERAVEAFASLVAIALEAANRIGAHDQITKALPE